MKPHYSRRLLFALPLNIWVYNKNKPYIITRHIPIYTSRVFRKCDTQSSNYDKDADMKSVKENFHRQTSQRFEVYEERMKVKRQKHKEQRDKNTEQIIEKDKMDKSLEEKGCLKYGCGLEGVAESVGLFGGLGIYGWKSAALAVEKKAAMVEATVKGAAKGVAKVIELVNLEFGILTLGAQTLETVLNVINYTNEKLINESIYMQYQSTCQCIDPGPVTVDPEPICISVGDKSVPGLGGQGVFVKEIKVIEKNVGTIVSKAKNVAVEALKRATEEVIKTSTSAVEYIFSSCQIAIIASVVAILVIVLVMLFIYLVLRYRRKKKMKKKAKYTKLLNK
ncbi:rifin [Plasmodium reichenowi]|uniref:Rifin n=1 Tax=Plasmodium reichenowi TaxID=5854 RepID=A0A060RR28_PLARE|nr:rifin [Plasmodium reichenowi]